MKKQQPLLFLLLLISLLLAFSAAKGKGGGNKKSGGGDNTSDIQTPDEKPRQHEFGLFVAQNPNFVFVCIVIAQVICGIGFSFWFKYQYIHNPKR